MLRPFCVVKLGDHSILVLTLKDGRRGGGGRGGRGEDRTHTDTFMKKAPYEW